MKQIIFSLLAFFIVEQSNAQSAAVDTLVVQSNIACDHCIQCGTCGTRIEDAVLGLNGVKNVQIEPTANTITVYYKTEKVTPEQIRQSIAAVGYDADEVKAEAAGVQQLDACCLGKEE